MSQITKDGLFNVVREYLDRIGCPSYDEVELRQYLVRRFGNRLRSTSIKEKQLVPLSTVQYWAREFQQDKYERRLI